MPVSTDRWLRALNEIPPKASALIEDKGWVQDVMVGQEGELCIVSALHEANRIPGLSHAVREVLTQQQRAEDWNDTPGRTKVEVVGFLEGFTITEEDLYDTFGPGWALVLYFCEFFGNMTEEEATHWVEGHNQINDYRLLQHINSQEAPDEREARAVNAVTAASNERLCSKFHLNPMGPSVALVVTKAFRPTLQPLSS